MESGVKIQKEPTFSELPEEVAQELDEMREFIKMHVPEDSLDFFNTVEGKLFVVQQILDLKLYPEKAEWICAALGVAFGDAFSLALKSEWALVEDEYGTSVALVARNGDREAYLTPLTTISRRAMRSGVSVDVAEIFTILLERAERQLNIC
jgi:hypothetical protein